MKMKGFFPLVSVEKRLAGTPNAIGIQDENVFLQFAVSTLVPFWQPQKYSPNTERLTFPLRELNPMKGNLSVGQLCVALDGMWGSVQ